MQLITFFSTASAMAATALAVGNAVSLNEACDLSNPYARVINRCSYDVYLWHVAKGDMGCPEDGMVKLKSGEIYAENYNIGSADGSTGVSIKISKTKQCKGVDITQLEYFNQRSGAEAFQLNYLDISYVDCSGEDCPARQDGYHLVAHASSDVSTAGSNPAWCPTMSCNDTTSCDKISYVLPDDVQTKTCDLDASIDFYMCGDHAPSSDDESAPEPSTSSSIEPTSTSASDGDTYTENVDVSAAAVTPAPEVKQVESAVQGLTKTKVVYVTAYQTVNAKRHAHGHARRHQPFHA